MVKCKDIDMTGGMNTISMNSSIAMIKTAERTSLSQVSNEALKDQVLLSASLPAHTRKMV